MFKQWTIKKILSNEWTFFISLFGVISWVFYRAYNMHFFADDYFFLKLSNIKNAGDFLHFYSPIRTYSYKPLASETFYFLLHLLNTNVFLGHIIIFITYFVALFYLYKIILFLTNNKLLAKLTLFIYGISFIHVFQLYWFATYQEVILFCFLTISFYTFLKNKYGMSILFFILASLCKETAALYTPFLILFLLWQNKGKLKIKTYYQLGIIVMLTLGFWLMYKIGLDHVTSLDNYKINWDMRLLLNNSMWYGLWGIGFPNFMSDYFRSIFSKPLPAFWDILKNHDIQMYFYQLLTYWSLFTGFLIAYIFFNRKSFKTYLLLSIFSLVGFLIFLGPILFFHHKWMVRLTLPLIFISLFQAYFIVDLLKNNLMTKIMAIILVIMYASWNYFGIKTHEYSSLYMMENDIYMRSSEYFLIHKNEIKNKSYIYFKDNDQNKNDIFKNSQKLKLSFHSQSFLDHFFSGKKITALYSFESPTIPPNAFIVNTYSLFSY